MRRVVLYQLLSLDGVAEEPGDWMFDIDQDVFDNLGNIIATQDAILLGRNTYDYWVDYWPTSDVEPFASFINNTQKHVFTSRDLTGEWANTTVVKDPAVDYVTSLKQGDGGELGIHGSIALARSLLRADLVDEIRLVVSPAVANTGRRLFGDADGKPRRLDLVDSRHTPSGLLLLTYQNHSG
jgi:dihydrofolate reductase